MRDMLAATGEDQRRLALRGDGFSRRRIGGSSQEQSPNSLGKWGSSWFSGLNDLVPFCQKELSESPALCGLSTAFNAFKRDEGAAPWLLGCADY